ncbi:hypothetical protein PCL_10489 [Purpureocillium lilacinum]|uniref:Nitrogen regulatory protein areA GATA-like domain-containing protein n=1 Tax=Purpureocillium lilacinum TaxID=33203 RepID=A0A2U3DQ91_PURLI|nr:hypothetical protein PCL_10489 [Purpureocillium lilacinum]
MRRSRSQPRLTAASLADSKSSSMVRNLNASQYISFTESGSYGTPPPLHTGQADPDFPSTQASSLVKASECDKALYMGDSCLDRCSLPIGSLATSSPPSGAQHDNSGPHQRQKASDSGFDLVADMDNCGQITGPNGPAYLRYAADDSAAASKPTRQVDYLSDDWREEDIRLSWRYIISKRHELPNSNRLENASWRAWARARNDLRRVSPDTLNWLKVCDVTCLYGPLGTGSNRVIPAQSELSSSNLPGVDSSVNLGKHPILKKQNVSKLMSQSTTLPYPVPKHIRFDERVQQCISVDTKSNNARELDKDRWTDSSDSDDCIMMGRVRPERRHPLTKRAPGIVPQPSSKTIATLPSTTLKCRVDEPDPGVATIHSMGAFGCPTTLSSQRPCRCLGQHHSCRLSDKQDSSGEDAGARGPEWRSRLQKRVHRSASTGTPQDETSRTHGTSRGTSKPGVAGNRSNGGNIAAGLTSAVTAACEITHNIWNAVWRK